MLNQIREWLNGPRNYLAGVRLYAQNSPNANVLAILQLGENPVRRKRLEAEILSAYNSLQVVHPAKAVVSQNEKKVAPNAKKVASNAKKLTENVKTSPEQPAKVPNQQLYDLSLQKATEKYKAAMNARAILFNLADCGKFEDPNLPHRIHQRTKLSLTVVQGYQEASRLFDIARYVQEHGRLPTGEESEAEETDYDNLPTELIKHQLDNARKALSKLKKKEVTPERLELIQKHTENIKHLSKKWHLLQP